MRLARWSGGLSLGLLLGILILSSWPGLSTPHPIGASVPSIGPLAEGPAGPSAHLRADLAQSARPSDSMRSSAARPSDACSNAPNWVSGSTNFFNDVDVCFSVPGNATPPNIPTVPLVGNLSQYVLGFWINISSNVQIYAANVCLWATGWPVPGLGPQPIAGFDPSQWNSADCRGMIPGTSSGHNPDTAAYFVNLYKYFFPGSNLSFMIEVTSGVGQIYSYKTLNVTEAYSSGFTTYPTWEVSVLSPFASYNFSDDFHLQTIPSVLTPPTFPPNPTQSVQMVLTSFSQNGGPLSPIPAAYAEGTVVTPGKDGLSTPFSLNFGPANSTVMRLNNPIPPQPAGTKV
ncbi:MAG TPA: hypothetical protein VGS23_00175, partial [Thermoplasmata archaeon]|nr:hypothetical protein [Thermoplasmata archaeon]